MKKRILSIVLAMLILIPFVLALTSCDKERTEEEIINDIINSGIIALKLSLWIPTNADTNSPEFNESLTAVQDEINAILRDKNYSTEIEIKAVSSDEYEEQLKAKFEDIKEKVAKKNGLLPSNISQSYVNEANKVSYGDSYMYELAYPDVLDTQVDIFMIRNYEDYVDLVLEEDGKGNALSQVYCLDSYISKLGGKYSDIHRMISPEVFSQYAINGSYYAIPNNHLYAEDYYQYILIDKEAFGLQDEIAIESLTDIGSCESFIKAIGEMSSSGYIPFVGSLDDAPNFVDFDASNLIGSTYENPAPSSIYSMEEYTSYVEMYKKLEEMGYVKESLADNEKAAVSFFYGSSVDASKLADNYYLIKSEMPVANENSFSSMFAISKYSANYDRAMNILYLLLTNSEIITLLQYGVEGKDYKIEEVDGQEVIQVNPNSAYDMSNLNIGNSYHTYTDDGSTIDEWDYVKEVNYDVVSYPYWNLANNFEKNATAEEKDRLAELKESVNAISSQVNDLVDNMSSEEYALFIKLYSVNLDSLVEEIEALEEGLSKETKTEKIEEIQNNIDELNYLKNAYEENEVINLLFSSDAYSDLLSFYNEIFTKYN